ncbi:glutathione S-transferase, partial [Phyllosticta paracitricarpa]
GDQTSYINYIKPLIFAEELGFPHLLSVIDTRDEWFYAVHPKRIVPSLKDQDDVTGEKIIGFEGTACLQYLAAKFDNEGLWTGRTWWEKAQVLSWTAFQTAGLGSASVPYACPGYPTRQNPEPMPKTCAKLHANTLKAWDLLEKRLDLPGKQHVALPDRPTLVDLSYFPFGMPWMFGFFGVDIKDWPSIQRWSELMLARPAVQKVMDSAPSIGHRSAFCDDVEQVGSETRKRRYLNA